MKNEIEKICDALYNLGFTHDQISAIEELIQAIISREIDLREN